MPKKHIQNGIGGLLKRLRRAVSVLKHGNDRLDRLEAQVASLTTQIAQLETRNNAQWEELAERVAATEGATMVNTAALAITYEPKSNSDKNVGGALLGIPHSFSIVINTFNRKETLQKTLVSLFYQRRAEFEVVVVNGPSTDGTLEMLEQDWREHVKIVSCPDRNLARSRNLGIAAASGEIIVFLDDDAVPEPDWLDVLANAYQGENIAGVGGFTRDRTGVSFQAKHIIIDRFGRASVDNDVEASLENREKFAPQMASMIGANSSFRRDALVRIGGFDERYKFWLEEADLIARLIDSGFDIRQCADAEVHHAVAPSDTRSVTGRTTSWRNIARSRIYFALSNAVPGTKLADILPAVSRELGQVLNALSRDKRDGNIDHDEYDRLVSELWDGTQDGAAEALREDSRRTKTFPKIAERKVFPQLLPNAQRLRIAFVTGLYPPRARGGVAVFIKHLASQLAKEGHEISIMTFVEPHENHTVSFEDGLWVHRMPLSTKQATSQVQGFPPMPPLREMGARIVLKEIERVQERRQFDWVVGGLWDVDLAGVIAAQNLKTAIYLVTSLAQMADESADTEVRMMVDAERWSLENANVIFASTKAIKRDIERAHNISFADQKMAVVPFGIPEANKALIPPVVDETLRLLFVGRFEKRKGIDVLLTCIPELMEKYKTLEIHLLGDHSIVNDAGTAYWADFVTQHKNSEWMNRIFTPGIVSEAELVEHVWQCDVFVAPSRYESFGLVYIEAMRCGKPCIGTSSGGVVEVISDNEEGLLVPPADAVALSQAIQKLISDEYLRSQMGARALKRYEQDFTVRRFAQNFVETLRQH